MMSGMQGLLIPWLESLKHYAYMCLLLSSPERLPYAPRATLLTICVYFAVGLLLIDAQQGAAAIGGQILLEISMLGLIAYLGLNLKGLLPRWQQTFSALVGINLVITAASIPLRGALGIDGAEPNRALIYLTLALLFWNLAVVSLIFRRAFEISVQLSAMIAFSYFVVYQIISVWFYT